MHGRVLCSNLFEVFPRFVPFPSCCQATSQALPTCSNPALQVGTPQRPTGPITSLLCPYPPPVPFKTKTNPDAPLADISVFVDEYLLNVSMALTAPTFFNRFVSGFVLHDYESPMSTCGCLDSSETCSDSLELALENFTIVQGFPQNQNQKLVAYCTYIKKMGFLNQEPTCPAMDNRNGGWNTGYNGIIQACMDLLACNSTNDGGNSGVLPNCTCKNSNQCNVGRTTVPQPSTAKLTATVWYNNQVSTGGGGGERERKVEEIRERERQRSQIVWLWLE